MEIRLGQPDVTFEKAVLGSVPMIPEHVWSQIDNPQAATGDEALIGTGPYRLVARDLPQGRLAFDANDDYFLGRPFVRRIEMITVDDQLVAVRAGRLDGGQAPVEGVRNDVIDPFRSDPRQRPARTAELIAANRAGVWSSTSRWSTSCGCSGSRPRAPTTCSFAVSGAGRSGRRRTPLLHEDVLRLSQGGFDGWYPTEGGLPGDPRRPTTSTRSSPAGRRGSRYAAWPPRSTRAFPTGPSATTPAWFPRIGKCSAHLSSFGCSTIVSLEGQGFCGESASKVGFSTQGGNHVTI